MRCPSCELAVINGVVCHEQDCPDSHLYITRSCEWCGNDFKPATQKQDCCDEECRRSYYEY